MRWGTKEIGSGSSGSFAWSGCEGYESPAIAGAAALCCLSSMIKSPANLLRARFLRLACREAEGLTIIADDDAYINVKIFSMQLLILNCCEAHCCGDNSESVVSADDALWAWVVVFL